VRDNAGVLDATGRPRGVFAETVRRLPRQVLLPGVAIYALIVALGLLLTQVLESTTSTEDAVSRALVEGRSDGWTTVTGFFGLLSNTPAIIATMVVTAIVLRLAFHRWRESIMVITAVSLQVVIFLLTAMVIDRKRPDVPKLDEAPPTSSFPSGHTGAATALYLSIALIILWHLHRSALKVIALTALVAIPLAVAVSRLYRGMHHPTDVLVGFINGFACLAVATRAYLLDRRE
jgi:membrane-associated phospholipid phosphatase